MIELRRRNLGGRLRYGLGSTRSLAVPVSFVVFIILAVAVPRDFKGAFLVVLGFETAIIVVVASDMVSSEQLHE